MQLLLLPLLSLIKVCAHAVAGNFIAVAVNCIYLVIASSSSIGMQSSAVHGRAVARNSSYCEAQTLRSNATTSDLFSSMANFRGVLPKLQAGGWMAIMRIMQHKIKQLIQNIHANLFFAFTSALSAISSSHTAG